MAGLPTNSNVLERQRLEQQRQEQQRIDALKHFGQLFKQRQIEPSADARAHWQRCCNWGSLAVNMKTGNTRRWSVYSRMNSVFPMRQM